MQQLTLSPQGRVRLIAPDLARGFMLLLIALANVPIWIDLKSGVADPISIADRAWVVARTIFIDGRSYPLFAFLLGFGLATMSRPQPWLGYAGLVERARTMRRRGLWLLAFGAVHALLFPGDILGAYGIIVLIFAGLIAARNDTALKVIGVILGIVYVLFSLFVGVVEGVAGGGNFADDGGGPGFGLVGNWGLWLVISAIAPVMSFMVPAVVFGVYAADRGWLNGLPQHRSRLLQVGVGGLVAGALLGLPFGLQSAGWGGPGWWIPVMDALGGPLSAAGWVALFTWISTFVRVDPGQVEAQTGLGLFVALGRRSMTGYLGQSVLFGLIFLAAASFDMVDQLTPAVAALAAVVVWAVTVLVCQLLARAGRPGPADQWLRRLVQVTARKPKVIMVAPHPVQYPGQQYPGQQYPGQQYPGQQYPTHPQQLQRPPSPRP